MEFLQLLISNLLTQPGFFIGLLVFAGLLVIKKPVYEAVAGFVKTSVGFFILTVGSSGLTSTFSPIISALKTRFGMEAAMVDTYFLMGQMYGEDGLYSIGNALTWTMITFGISFAWNFILVIFNKWTRCRTLYVTGHTMQVYSTIFIWMVYLVSPESRNLSFSILFGILAGTWAAVGSNLTVEATQNLTGNGGFAVGHQVMLGIWFTDKAAHLFGKKEDSVENIKLPGFLSIFHDNVVSTAILMTVFLGTIMGFIGRDALAAADPALKPDTLLLTYILTKCFHFSVYMYILLSGVRMFVSELMKAFDGISKKVIKGAMPAVDCAVTYNYSHPNVPLFGFIFGFFGQLLAIAGLLLFKSPLFLVPGFVPLFFDNATIAVFANKKGGRRAAIILPFLNGIFQVMVTFGMLLFIKEAAGFSLTAWPAMFDNNTFLPLVILAHAVLNPYVATILLVILLLAITQIYYRRHKEHYYDHMK